MAGSSARNSKLPFVGAFGSELVAEAFAEELVEELGVDGGFFVLVEFPGGFEFGPLGGDFERAVLGGGFELEVGGGFAEEAGDEEGSLAAEPAVEFAGLFVVEAGAVRE